MKPPSSLLLILALFLLAPLPTRAAGTGGSHLTPDTSAPDTSPPALPRWQQLFPATNPPARSEPALAYDTARGVAVLFGGSDGDARNDTWEWNSRTLNWARRYPRHSPPARFGAAMAYDGAHGVAVMFGGTNDYYRDYGDTWLWDGNDWTQVFPANAPSPRWLHAMVYDTQRQVVMLFGGTTAYEDSNTWEWDGSNWNEPDILEPSWRYGVALAYDSRRGAAVLFGGDEGYGWNCYRDTWERAGGGDWVEVIPNSKRPPDRARTHGAYFPRWRSTIVYGGITCTGAFLTDTWFWYDGRWIERRTDPHPTGACGVMVYDRILKGLLLFVGCSRPGVVDNETWLLR